jgi:DnaK suppressor protein
MDDMQVQRFKEILQNERRRVLDNAEETLKNEMELSTDDLSDENDLASAVYDQNLALQLRGREKRLLSKVDLALQRIADGEFGICEECGDDISVSRLEARPVTTLCIACKEEQERRERSYA